MSVAACGGSASPGVASAGSTTTPSPSEQTAESQPSSSTRQSDLRYVSCMRSHGIRNFPDPLPGGGFNLPLDLKANPEWSSAQQACQGDLPGGGPAAKRAEHPLNVEEELRFTSCMRSHGFSDFPDPNSTGLLVISPSSGIDLNSPQFEMAEKACQPSGSAGIPIAIQSNGS